MTLHQCLAWCCPVESGLYAALFLTPLFFVPCRSFGCSAPVGTVYSINPAMIMTLVPLVGAAATHCSHFDMIHYGSYVSALSPLWMAMFSTGVHFACCICNFLALCSHSVDCSCRLCCPCLFCAKHQPCIGCWSSAALCCIIDRPVTPFPGSRQDNTSWCLGDLSPHNALCVHHRQRR